MQNILVPVQKQWKLILLGVISPIWEDADAWVPHGVKNNNACSFLPSSQKPTFSTTALSVLDRSDFFGQLAAGMAATANAVRPSKRPSGVHDTTDLNPLPIEKPNNSNNRTRSSGSGTSSTRRRASKPSSMLVEQEQGASRTFEGRSFKGNTKGTSSRGASSSGDGSACFPGDAWVQVLQINENGHESWRSTKMEDLVLGSRVLTGSDSISTIYAFGTKDPNVKIPFETFLGESGEVLEVTENHILFFANGTSEVAWNIDPENTLLRVWNNNHATRIIRKESIVKEGAYHPYTLDGKLLVNGFQVSVHSIDTAVPYLGIGEHSFFDVHEFQQLLFSPLRLLYWWSPETYSTMSNHDVSDGSHHYVDLIESLQIFLLPANDEETMVNFADWNLPMFPLRLLAIIILIACHTTEQALLLYSWDIWVAIFFGLAVVMYYVRKPNIAKRNDYNNSNLKLTTNFKRANQ